MSRIVIAEAALDAFRRSIGREKTVVENRPGNTIITNNIAKEFNVTFLRSDLVDKGFMYEESSILKIEPTKHGTLQAFKDSLRQAMPLNTIFTDHYTSIDQVSPVNTVEKEHLQQTITSYNINPVFNYLSLQYDLDSASSNEAFFPSIMERKQKTDFLDYLQFQ